MSPDTQRPCQPSVKHPRILLKISGEALMGKQASGINSELLARLAMEITSVREQGVEIALVIGGGNFFRGISVGSSGIKRVTGDHMGMLATVMNALAMRDALQEHGTEASIMSAINIQGIAPAYDRIAAMDQLSQGRVMIFAAGTGNPLFTTDSAACLRGIEIEANLVLKATKVNGVYSEDPLTHPDATRFSSLTFDEALEKKLMVMDLTAMCLMRDHNIPLQVFNINNAGALGRIVQGKNEGTMIHNHDLGIE